MPLVVAALAGLGVLASTSLAGAGSASSCTPHNSIGTSSFDYVLCGLPDIDQVRQVTPTTAGLPGDGYSYCGPTATMDGLAYFASHGAPALRPGAKDWTAAANYEEMTADIKDLGDLMGTTVSGGTTDGYFPGLDAWLQQPEPGVPLLPSPLVTSYLWVTNSSSELPADLPTMAAEGAAGDVVIPNVAFMTYEKPPAPATGPKQWLTVGGHYLAMSSATSPSTMGVHDPANPIAEHASQSPYAEETYTLKPVTSTFGYLDASGNDVSFKGTFLQVKDYFLDTSTTKTFVWGYVLLQPETVTTWSRYRILLVAPVRAGDPVEGFVSAGRRAVLDLAVDPAAARDYYVEQGSSSIWALNTASGASTPLASVTGRPALLGYAARTGTVFVAAARSLAAVDARGRGKAASRPLSEQVDAVVVNQESSRLLALSAESGKLRVYDSRLRLLGTVQLPTAPLRGTGRISISLRGNVVYVHRDGKPAVGLYALRGLALAGARFVRLEGAVRPTGLAVDDSGDLFVQSKGTLAEFAPSGKPLAASRFDGKPAGSGLTVNRDFSSADPRTLPARDSPLPRRR